MLTMTVGCSSPSNFASSSCYTPPSPASLPKPPVHWIGRYCTTFFFAIVYYRSNRLSVSNLNFFCFTFLT
jgi:hypothetical protein